MQMPRSSTPHFPHPRAKGNRQNDSLQPLTFTNILSFDKDSTINYSYGDQITE